MRKEETIVMESLTRFVEKLKTDHASRKSYLKRMHGLPENYRRMYTQIVKYVWSLALDGPEVQEALLDVLEMMETGAAKGLSVRDVVGEDVKAFCDDILEQMPNKTWMHRVKNRLGKFD